MLFLKTFVCCFRGPSYYFSYFKNQLCRGTYQTVHKLWDHSFKTSACFRGVGVKKLLKFADVYVLSKSEFFDPSPPAKTTQFTDRPQAKPGRWCLFTRLLLKTCQKSQLYNNLFLHCSYYTFSILFIYQFYFLP